MRFLILIILPVLLASCYRPMYGERPFGAAATQEETRLNSIHIANIPNEQGQILRNFLIDRMYGAGRPDKTDATLSVTISTGETDLGLQRDATTVRKKLVYAGTYFLTDNKTQQSLTSGAVRSIVFYDKIDAQYGALASKDAAAERALREISDLIVNQLLVYIHRKDGQVEKERAEKDTPADPQPHYSSSIPK